MTILIISKGFKIVLKVLTYIVIPKYSVWLLAVHASKVKENLPFNSISFLKLFLIDSLYIS